MAIARRKAAAETHDQEVPFVHHRHSIMKWYREITYKSTYKSECSSRPERPIRMEVVPSASLQILSSATKDECQFQRRRKKNAKKKNAIKDAYAFVCSFGGHR